MKTYHQRSSRRRRKACAERRRRRNLKNKQKKMTDDDLNCIKSINADGLLHSYNDMPASVRYANSEGCVTSWYYHGQLSRLEQPAVITSAFLEWWLLGWCYIYKIVDANKYFWHFANDADGRWRTVECSEDFAREKLEELGRMLDYMAWLAPQP